MKTILSILLLLNLSACLDDQQKVELDSNLNDKNLQLSSSSECPEYLMKRKKENLNISILLDLSSRIDEPNQQANDSAYIVSISNVFNTHIKKKKLGLLKDNLQLLFHPTPKNPKINELSEKLKISYVKGVSKKELTSKTDSVYSTIPAEIYNLARQDFIENHEYPGSDIWRFFKDDIDDYSMDDCYRNIVIILTDGYMYFENTKMEEGNRTSYLTPKSLDNMPLNNSNWKDIMAEKGFGFITKRNNLEDAEVLILGVQSHNKTNPYARDIIIKYWENWLEEMGVKSSKVKQADIPSNMDKIIKEFILN